MTTLGLAFVVTIKAKIRLTENLEIKAIRLG